MKFKHTPRGYTFVEVIMAAALIGMAMGAGVRLIATMAMQEEIGLHNSIAMNLQENSCRLWQLGLSPTEVANVLPIVQNNNDLDNCIVQSGLNAVTFGTPTTTTLSNSMGTLEKVTTSVTIAYPGGNSRVNTMQVYRPTTR